MNSTSWTDGADRLGAVQNDVGFNGRRDAGFEPRQFRFNTVDDVDDVGAWLLEDRQDHAFLVVLIRHDRPVHRSGDCLADVAHPDRCAVSVGEHDVVELIGVDDLVVRGDREAHFVAVDAALGGIGRLRNERGANVLKGDAARGELEGIDLDPN